MNKKEGEENKESEQSIYQSVWRAVNNKNEEKYLMKQRDQMVDFRHSLFQPQSHNITEDKDDIPDEKGIFYDALRYFSPKVEPILKSSKGRMPVLSYIKVQNNYSLEGWLLFQSLDNKCEWRVSPNDLEKILHFG